MQGSCPLRRRAKVGFQWPQRSGRIVADVGAVLPISPVSEPQSTLSVEGPVDATAIPCNPRDLAANVVLQRWRPRYQLEAQAIIDHGEATRGKRQPLTEGSANDVATCDLLVRE